MQNIIVNKTDDLYTLAEGMRVCEDTEVVFVVSPDILFLQNPLSFKFLERYAEAFGKKISFVDDKNEALSFAEPKSFEDVPKAEKEVPKSNLAPKTELSAIIRNSISIIGALLLLIGIGVSVWWFFPKANVVIKTNSEMLVKNVDITANVSATGVNESNKEIPAVLLETVRKASDTIQASGEKEVGEKAKGTVTMFNKTISKKTFGKGTKLILISAETEDLNYYTLEEVTIEERQDLAEGITYGSVEVGVEAEKYGSNYNIKEDQKFEVDDHDTSNFLAQNEEVFTGGSSKIVPAVSEKDKEALKSTLEERLRGDVKTDLELKLVGEQKIAENSTGFETFDEVFDKNVGDDADKLNLSLQVRAYALAYYRNDLENVVKSVLERSIPEQYSLADTETRFEIGDVLADKPTPLSKDKISLLVKVRSFVVPKLDAQEVKDNLVNRSILDATKYLDGLKNIASYEFTVWPRLPGFLSATPHIKSRIQVEIKNE